RASLVLKPVVEETSQGPKVEREVDAFSAEQNVFVEAPNVGRARCGLLRWRPLERELVLQDPVDGSRPKIEAVRAVRPPAINDPRDFDEYTADRFTWRSTLRQLIAEGRTKATVRMPLLPWIEREEGADAKAPVVTAFEGGRTVADFDEAPAGGGAGELR